MFTEKIMDKLKIEATKSSPEISFDSEDNLLEIKGVSYPANIEEVYAPVFSWLENYLEQLEDQEVAVNMEIIYFNSGSSMIFTDFFRKLENSVNKGKKISVNWIYEEDDEDSLEFGEDFQEDFKSLIFNFAWNNV